MLLGIVALAMRVRTQGTEERNKTISDKRYHELLEWNESLEWKHGENSSIVQSNQRAVLVTFGVFVLFVIKLLGIVALPMHVRTQGTEGRKKMIRDKEISRMERITRMEAWGKLVDCTK